MKYGLRDYYGYTTTAPDLIASNGDSLREAFGKALVKLADKYPDFVVLDADVAGGTGTYHFKKNILKSFFSLVSQNKT